MQSNRIAIQRTCGVLADNRRLYIRFKVPHCTVIAWDHLNNLHKNRPLGVACITRAQLSVYARSSDTAVFGWLGNSLELYVGRFVYGGGGRFW
jgi:hypothetical protein